METEHQPANHHHGEHNPIVVIFEDRSTVVKVNGGERLGEVVSEALNAFFGSGHDREGWEIRDSSHIRLDLHETIRDFDFPHDVVLFLHRVHEHQLKLTIVVGGEEAKIPVDEKAPLGSVIPVALEMTGNKGREPDAYELKDEEGHVLDLVREIGQFHFSNDTLLFLSLKAGVAGADSLPG